VNAELSRTDHRDEPPPIGPHVMSQRWCDLLFAHWRIEPATMRRALPEMFEPDLYDGFAWLGVVPFRMEAVRLRGLPAVPGLSAFPELNVRTYVRRGGRSGVYFFSLDAASALAVAVARTWFGLPYYRAQMSCVAGTEPVAAEDRSVVYSSVRRHRGAPPAEFRAEYRPVGPVFSARRGTLEHFLVERYRLWLERGGRAIVGEIHHAPWPLRAAEAQIATNTVAAPHGFALAAKPDHLAFARRIETREWSPRAAD
jgi:uncharacterized protein YqjF (DUF2071 family)